MKDTETPMEWDHEPCVWCNRPRIEHGEPTDVMDWNTSPPTPTGRMGKLCPVNGVTSQFWAPAIAIASPTWQTSVLFDAMHDTTIDMNIEQSARNKPIADIRFVIGGTIINILGVKPKDLKRLGEAFHEADYYVRLCSDSERSEACERHRAGKGADGK